MSEQDPFSEGNEKVNCSTCEHTICPVWGDCMMIRNCKENKNHPMGCQSWEDKG